MTTTCNQVQLIITLQKVQEALERRPWTRLQFIRSIAQRGLTKPSVISQAVDIVAQQLHLALLRYPWTLVFGACHGQDLPTQIDPEWPSLREQQTLDRLLITANRIRRWGIYYPKRRHYDHSGHYERFLFERTAQVMMSMQALRYPECHAAFVRVYEIQRRSFPTSDRHLLVALGKALYSDPDVRSGKPPTRDKVGKLLQKILDHYDATRKAFLSEYSKYPPA